MGDFMWINKDARSKSLTTFKNEELQAVRSFLQRKHSPPHHSLKHEEPDAPSETHSGAADEDDVHLLGNRQRRKSTSRPAQTAMQSRWRLTRHWTRKKPQVLFEKSHRSVSRTADTPSVNISSYHSGLRNQPGSRLQYVTRDSEMAREDREGGIFLPAGSSPQPHSYLGAGRVDPFGRIAGFELPPYGHEVLDYAINTFWPTFIPLKGNSQLHPIKSSWLDACRKSPMVFFTFLFGAAENHLMHRGGIDYNPDHIIWRLHFHSLAIKHINEKIGHFSKTGELPSDELLACILTLSVYGAQKKTTPLSKSSLALSKAQTLEAVSHRQHVQAHKNALIYLVSKKGGLSNGKMYAISVLIQATDLLWSTLEHRAPNLIWSQDIPVLPPELYEAPSQRLSHQHVATNFSHVPNIIWPASYTEVITSIRQLIIALDSTDQAGTTETYLGDLVAFRNWIQHCLLSLPVFTANPSSKITSSSLPSTGRTDSPSTMTSQPTALPRPCSCILSVTCTSLLILSTFIIFAIPPSPHLNTTLLTDLYCCIAHDDWAASPVNAREYAKLIMWASMLGGVNCVAAEAEPGVEARDAKKIQIRRTRFTATLAVASGTLEIGASAEGNDEDGDDEISWHELKHILEGFLWYDSALGEMAREMWRDVRVLREVDAGEGFLGR